MSGARVLITRAAEDAAALTQAFGRLGLEPVLVPLLARQWDAEAVLSAVDATPSPDVVFVTSATTARILGALVPTRWSAARWVAVGPSTAAVLQNLGFTVDHVPPEATAASLVSTLPHLEGSTVVYPKADLADPATSDDLRARGAHVIDVVAYRNLCPPDAGPRLLEALPVAATPLMSGSAARRIGALVPAEQRDGLGRILAIGPSTARAAQEAGLRVYAVAHPHTAGGLVRETARALGLTYP